MEDKKFKKESLDLDKLKQKYETFKNKYFLEDFRFINENFEIENIDSDSELLLKAIRKHMTEKIFYILRSLEMFMNPQNAPLFIFNVIKSMAESDKELVKKIYEKVSCYEIEAFGLEAIYSEKKEAEFIKRVAGEWKNIAESLNKLYISMKNSYRSDFKKAEKSYLG